MLPIKSMQMKEDRGSNYIVHEILDWGAKNPLAGQPRQTTQAKSGKKTCLAS